MRLRPEKVLANARQATTDDLLDRVTVQREGMDPEALEIFEAELARRGITPDEIAQHERHWRHRVLRGSGGQARICHVCGRVAMVEYVGWHKFWGLLPLFRRRFHVCGEHGPG